MEKKLLSEKHKIYSNLSRWQRLELARHPNRPYSSDYIKSITDNWIELHGDRKYADDSSIICAISSSFHSLSGVGYWILVFGLLTLIVASKEIRGNAKKARATNEK